eukprot:COSAG01_NODE_7312_length_3256_cov_4.489072_2_plen_835_part_01
MAEQELRGVSAATLIQSMWRGGQGRQEFLDKLEAKLAAEAEAAAAGSAGDEVTAQPEVVDEPLVSTVTEDSRANVEAERAAKEAEVERELLAEEQARLRSDAATKVQSVWRGGLCRKQLVDALETQMEVEMAEQELRGRADDMHCQQLELRRAKQLQVAVPVPSTRDLQPPLQDEVRQPSISEEAQQISDIVGMEAPVAARSSAEQQGAATAFAIHASQRDQAAIRLQSLWRGTQARRVILEQLERQFGVEMLEHELRDTAAVLIQAVWRGVRCRQQMLRTVSGLLQELEVVDEAERTHAATIVQAHWRGGIARHRHLETLRAQLHAGATQKRAATAIQSLRRSRQALQQFQRLRGATVTTQAAVRCAMGRRRYRRAQAAVVVIQACARGSAVRAMVTQQLDAELDFAGAYQALRTEAAGMIQQAWRAHTTINNESPPPQPPAQHGRDTAATSGQQQLGGGSLLLHEGGLEAFSWSDSQSTSSSPAVRAFAAHFEPACDATRGRLEGLAAATTGTGTATATADFPTHAVWRIQSHWRGHCVRRRLLRDAEAALAKEMAHKAAATRFRDYVHSVAAALTVQSHWRGRCVRRRLLRDGVASLPDGIVREAAPPEITIHEAAAAVRSRDDDSALARSRSSRGAAACTVIQSHFRGRGVRRRLLQEAAAAATTLAPPPLRTSKQAAAAARFRRCVQAQPPSPPAAEDELLPEGQPPPSARRRTARATVVPVPDAARHSPRHAPHPPSPAAGGSVAPRIDYRSAAGGGASHHHHRAASDDSVGALTTDRSRAPSQAQSKRRPPPPPPPPMMHEIDYQPPPPPPVHGSHGNASWPPAAAAA